MPLLRWLAPLLLVLFHCAATAETLERAVFAAAGGPAPHEVTLPHEWDSSDPAFTGIGDYVLRFGTPPGDGLLAVYVQRACTNLEVYVNGQAVGSGGRLGPPVTRNCYYPHLFTLPRPLLREGGNELRIRVAGFAAREVSARQRAAGLSEVQVGPLAELQEAYDTQLFWNITAAQIIAATIAALGLTMLGLALVRRQDTYLLYFGLYSLGWALISSRLFIQHVPLPHVLTEVLICSAFPPVLGCSYLFLIRMVGRRWVWMDVALLLQALAVPVALAIAAPEGLLRAATAVYNLLALEFLLVVGAFFTIAWKRRRHEFWLLGFVLVVAVVLAAAEIALQNNLLPLPKVHLIHFAMPFIFLVISLRLVQLFVRALQHAETLNLQLEGRVAEKSREIERNWQQIAQLRTAEAAQAERRRIASDLHDDLGAQLLTITQASERGGQPERIAGLARRAMEEMRLSVRGLTSDAAHAAEVLADWRAETVTRLSEAGLAAHWEAEEPSAGLVLPARMHVQLTRVLREAVSNAIRHSGARSCGVRIRFDAQHLCMEVQDDGRGLAGGAASRGGHGLPNIERRVRNLGGEHRFETPEGGGTRLVLRVPLAMPASALEIP